MAGPAIRQRGDLFLDAHGRQVMLRGVNLGGDCKAPYPDGGTDRPSDFSDHRAVSFIGRPFPLADADRHLARIAGWGFNALRLLTTWEAVEHAGPGLYDTDYLDFLAEVARRAGEHGLSLFVDFHQDAWSRMSGGDGAPGWTFEAVGLDFNAFDQADAAHVMQARYDYADPAARQASYPQMSWGSNYRLPANTIMWSLFWAGRRLTPRFEVDGANVQDFLQGRYLGAMGQVARRLRDLPNVLGFDTLNEPSPGWLGQPLTYRHVAPSADHPERPRVGPALSPLDGLAMAQGLTVTVPVLTREPGGAAVPTQDGTLNARGRRIWRDGVDCPFEEAGAYRLEGGRAVPDDEGFFLSPHGRPLSLRDDAYAPFFQAVAATIRPHQADWSVFAEMDAFALSAGHSFPPDLPERTVNASHWYDVRTLYLKRFHAPEGPDAVRERFIRQLGDIAAASAGFPGGAPTLIGEFGIPFDLDEGAAYARWARGEREGLWEQHVQALELMYDAIDALALHSTQWNYTASNRNDLRVGDGWNQEDLSIYSADQADDPGDPQAGGRAVEGFCRPYAQRIQGRLVEQRFDREAGRFRLAFEADAAIAAPTVVFAPKAQYPRGFVVRFEGAPADLERDGESQRVTVRATASGPAWLTLEPIEAAD